MINLLKTAIRKQSHLSSWSFNKECFSSTQRTNYLTNDLQCVEVITRDYSGSLIHLLGSFKDKKVNLTCLETRLLNRTLQGQEVLFQLSFNRQTDLVYDSLIDDLKQKFDKVIPMTEAEIPNVPWFPRTQDDFQHLGADLLKVKDLVNQDHPQFKDQEYRKRREQVGATSQSHIIGQEIPLIDYTKKENETWVKIYKRLKEEHAGVMSKRFMKNLNKVEHALGFQHKLPQLRDIDAYLQAETGFRVKSVPGILNQRDFLNGLGHRVFFCTQYIRHHDTPEYTPEPDIVHEIVGHVPMFADQAVADLSQEIGLLSCGAQTNQVSRLGTIYWYTIEYGSHLEDGQPRGYGAGIASSIGELQHYPSAKFVKLNPFVHADDVYPIQSYQPVFMYSETFEQSLQEVIRFGESLQKPFRAYYDYKTKEIKTDRIIQTTLDFEQKSPEM